MMKLHDWEFQLNVWSNSVYLITGLLVWLWWGFSPIVPALLALSVASGLFHCTGTTSWQRLDEDAMYAVLVALLVEVGSWTAGVPSGLVWLTWAGITGLLVLLNHGLSNGLDSDIVMPVGAIALGALVAQTGVGLGHGLFLLGTAVVSGLLQLTARMDGHHHRWWHSGWHLGTCVLIYGILKIAETITL